MEILLSGLLGALFATILTIFYQYVGEQNKLRVDVMLEAVAYFDDIYENLQILHALKDALYRKDKKELSEDELHDYREANHKLTALLLSSRPGIKVAFVYGEDHVLSVFNELRTWFRIVTSILRKATPENWAEEHEGIMLKFSQQIDPLRSSFERILLQEAHISSIIKQRLRTILGTFYEYFWPKRA